MGSGGLDQTVLAKRLQLIRTPNIGPMTYMQFMEKYRGDIDVILDALPELATKAGKSRNLRPPPLAPIQDEILAATKLGCKFLVHNAPDFPAPLAALYPPPPIICVRGNMEALAKPGLAIVGSRNASAAGRKLTRDISAELAANGYTIISGMARGIDGEAHAAAIKNGHTIAVLAGGISSIYPPEHDRLYHAILEQGLIVSEAPLGYTATARDFPKRNRIITGLSMAVLVAEAAQRSGSLISARFALEQGREVLAIPGSPLDERTRGSNSLLKQGAWLIENADDVVKALEGTTTPMLAEQFQIDFDPSPPPQPDMSLYTMISNLLSPTPIHIEEILRLSDAPLRQVQTVITELELDGKASTHSGGTISQKLPD
jgi:DNA processing protein